MIAHVLPSHLPDKHAGQSEKAWISVRTTCLSRIEM